jgi:hypothetical protein
MRGLGREQANKPWIEPIRRWAQWTVIFSVEVVFRFRIRIQYWDRYPCRNAVLRSRRRRGVRQSGGTGCAK